MKKIKIKKKYNPFRMWGAWLGAIPIFILMFPSIQRMLPDAIDGNKVALYFLLTYFGFVCIGFLSGWMIHSIIKKYNLSKSYGGVILSAPVVLFLFYTLYLMFTCRGEECMIAMILPFVIIAIPVSFLLGWGIHSLVRRYK